MGCPGVPLFELGTPSRLFGAARSASGRPLYDVRLASVTGGQLRAKEANLELGHGPELFLAADTVLIPSSDDLLNPSIRSVIAETLAPWLLQDCVLRPGLRIASVCSGAFLLGQLGLLDHRRVTTHWRLARSLAEQFPAIEVHAESLYVEDGPVLTSGGVAAGIDLCLHVIRQDHGTAIANDVARSCVVAPLREGGQAQFVQMPIPEPSDSVTSDTVRWLLQTLDEPHTLSQIAQRAHMSTRTFERRFRREHGIAPGQWLTAARIRRAKELLELTDHPIERIAAEVGLGTASNLRLHFTRCVGRTPQAYRRSFSPTAANSGP